MSVLGEADKRTHEMHGARFTTLASPKTGARQTSVWRVELPPGSPATPHELTQEEIFVVTHGRARVRLGTDDASAGPGDRIVVPAHTPFALSVEGTEAFCAIVCFPVGGKARLADGQEFTPPWAE